MKSICRAARLRSVGRAVGFRAGNRCDTRGERGDGRDSAHGGRRGRGFRPARLRRSVGRAADHALPTAASSWDFTAYDFLDGAAPDTVNPSLWRHARLLALAGLFRVHERVYQVRGFDVSNMTIIVGDTGLDPGRSADQRRNRDARRLHWRDARWAISPVRAVIYTHSHADHFGGVRGVVEGADVAAGRVQIIAPEGFHGARGQRKRDRRQRHGPAGDLPVRRRACGRARKAR